MAVSTPNAVAQSDSAPIVSPRPGRPKLASGIWLALRTVLLIWTARALATAWPYVGLMPQWLLFAAVPGVLFRSFDLISMHAAKRRIGGWKRLLVCADAALHYDTRRFVLASQGRSLDIDGSTLFYDSMARVWR